MSDRKKVTLNLNLGGLVLFSFIVLKLTGVIDWKWVWVLAPLWVPFVGLFIVFIIWILIALSSNSL